MSRPETIMRRAARVLLVDAADRVLLLRGFDPETPDLRYWFTLVGRRCRRARVARHHRVPVRGALVPPGAGLLPGTGGRLGSRSVRARRDRAALDRRPPLVERAGAGRHERAGLPQGAARPPGPPARSGWRMLSPPRTVVHRAAGLYALERALQRRGFEVVAGADEAGRGACAGPLVVAAAILPPGRRGEIDGLTDSKLLAPAVRERIYTEVVARATAYSVVVIPPGEIDTRGLHVCNVAGMRRALDSLEVRPEYILTDGFRVDGLGVPGLAVWTGDQVAACRAAASG